MVYVLLSEHGFLIVFYLLESAF